MLVGAYKGARLLVVAYRGHGGVSETLLGSVSTHCVHTAYRHVVAVRCKVDPTLSEPISDRMIDLLDSTNVVCRQWAEQDLGPYYVPQAPNRRDVTEDRAGDRLALGLALAHAGGAPLSNAIVEMWHCDASGQYSGAPLPGLSEHRGTAAEYLRDRTFLRGRQEADEMGMIEFRSIYPGWYPGRTVHIHLIVRTSHRMFVSQLYFDDSASDAVFGHAPYSERQGRDTTNATDTIFQTGGVAAVLELVSVDAGYLAAARLHLPVEARDGH